jgi:cytochrome c-type biogenesis protein CcmH
MKRTISFARASAAVFRAGALGLVLALLVLPLAGQQRSERAKLIGKRLMCLCGCNQVLIECNHVGCSMSDGMIRQLEQRITRNEPDDLILQSFVQEYGERVLAQPPAKGFGLAAWVMPGLVTVFGVMVVLVVLSRWRRSAAQPAAAVSPELLERARRELDEEGE